MTTKYFQILFNTELISFIIIMAFVVLILLVMKTKYLNNLSVYIPEDFFLILFIIMICLLFFYLDISRFFKIALTFLLFLICFFTSENEQEENENFFEKRHFNPFHETKEISLDLNLKLYFKDLISKILNILKKLSIVLMIVNIVLIGFPFLDFYSFLYTCECMGKIDDPAKKILTKDGQMIIKKFLFVEPKYIIPDIRWMHKKPVIQYILNYDEIIFRLGTRDPRNILIGKTFNGSGEDQYITNAIFNFSKVSKEIYQIIDPEKPYNVTDEHQKNILMTPITTIRPLCDHNFLLGNNHEEMLKKLKEKAKEFKKDE